jgi:Holliday junction resolvase RusA-like endonuclease
MIVLSLEIVKLPRINDKFNKNFSLKEAYRDKKANLVKELKLQNRGIDKIKSPYTVIVEVGTFSDIDASIKPLFDSMQESEVIDNDKNILKMIVEKDPLKKNKDNWIIVELLHYEKKAGIR